MPTYMPDTIQKALGEAATRDFTPWLETFMTEHTVGQDTWKLAQARFDGLETRQMKVETRLDSLETRQMKVETRLDGVESRLTMVEHDLAELKVEVRDLRRDIHERLDRMAAMFNERFDRQAAEMNARFDHQAAEVNGRFDRLQQQMLSQTRWTVGTLALFGTLITLLVGIGQLRP
jgi:chromosome segregation ATPase